MRVGRFGEVTSRVEANCIGNEKVMAHREAGQVGVHGAVGSLLVYCAQASLVRWSAKFACPLVRGKAWASSLANAWVHVQVGAWRCLLRAAGLLVDAEGVGAAGHVRGSSVETGWRSRCRARVGPGKEQAWPRARVVCQLRELACWRRGRLLDGHGAWEETGHARPCRSSWPLADVKTNPCEAWAMQEGRASCGKATRRKGKKKEGPAACWAAIGPSRERSTLRGKKRLCRPMGLVWPFGKGPNLSS